MRRLVLVFLFVVHSGLCLADNRNENGAEGLIDRDVLFRNELQKTAQDIKYNQKVCISQSYTDGEWIDRNKTVTMYDDLGNMTEMVLQSWESDEWVNFRKYTYSYNDQGDEIGSARFSWHDTEWAEYYKEIYTYDDKGNMIELLTQYYVNGEWENAAKSTNTYDQDGNLIEVYAQIWSDGEWETYEQEINEYDEQGNMSETLLRQHVNGVIIVSKFIFTYDDQGLMTEELRLSWSEETEVWSNSQKITCTYDDQGNIIEKLTQSWYDEEWKNFIVDNYTYDEDGRLTEYIFQSISGDELQPTARRLYFYDYVTNVAQNTSDTPAKIPLTANYPNPFNSTTTIEYTLPEAGYTKLVIYNIMGQKVRELMAQDMLAGIHSVVWDGRGENGTPVSSGMFVSRLTSGENVVSNRMMLVK